MTLKTHEEMLAPFATKASRSRGRLFPEPTSRDRTPFQHDRDRIIHSNAFRKMRNKTQVFIESEGDYYRTRLTHSLEVSQIARSISRALGLDEDLTETIALAHDLGHTCFGHAGEDGLNEALAPYGGFNHNEQTFRILTKLEHKYARFDGLNLTWETLEGVVKHSGPVLALETLPYICEFNRTWDLELASFAGPEAQVAALADDIAYNTHDVDDGYHAGIFQTQDLRDLPLFGPSLHNAESKFPDNSAKRIMFESVREVIGTMVFDVVDATRRNIESFKPECVEDIRHALRPTVAFSSEMKSNISTVHSFLYERMYRHENINEVCVKARKIVRDLFDYYIANPDFLPEIWKKGFDASKGGPARARCVADFIAGMTDRYAIKEHRIIFSSDMFI